MQELTREQVEAFKASLEVIECLKSMDDNKLELLQTMVRTESKDIQRWFDACLKIAQKEQGV